MADANINGYTQFASYEDSSGSVQYYMGYKPTREGEYVTYSILVIGQVWTEGSYDVSVQLFHNGQRIISHTFTVYKGSYTSSTADCKPIKIKANDDNTCVSLRLEGSRSAEKNFKVPKGGGAFPYVYNGDSFVKGIGTWFYDGTVWKQAKSLYIYDGSEWKQSV